MLEKRPSLIVLMLLQFIAIFIYPLSFFQAAPQAWVLPILVLFIPFILALLAMNTGVLTPLSGRTSLIFIQGINIVVRMMTIFPNLQDTVDNWNMLLLTAQIVGIALSWYTITQMEKFPLSDLLLRAPNNQT